MKIRKLLASAATALLIGTGLSLAVAAPASATNNDITCTTAWLEPHRALQNGDHINIEIVRGAEKFQVNAYLDQNIEGGANVNGMTGVGLRITAPGGSQVSIPLTAKQLAGDRLTFDYGKYIAGSFQVPWAQFNDSYFNADRDPEKVLHCGTAPEQPKKVVVCKYVGIPGVDERLQTGQNPIEVSVNTLKGFTGTFPWEFADAQGRSIAIGYAPGNYTLGNCPAPEQPPVVPEKPEDTTVEGEWITPQITCDNEVGDEVPFFRNVTITSWKLDQENNVWVSYTETVQERDIHIVSAADLEGLECPVVAPPTEEPPVEEPPVVTPPTEEPPVVTPPTEEPPVVTPPAPTETPAAVVPVSNDTPRLAATGGTPLNPWFLTLGALSVALGALSIMLTVLRRHPRSEV